jgi:hypothetical protein
MISTDAPVQAFRIWVGTNSLTPTDKFFEGRDDNDIPGPVVDDGAWDNGVIPSPMVGDGAWDDDEVDVAVVVVVVVVVVADGRTERVAKRLVMLEGLAVLMLYPYDSKPYACQCFFYGIFRAFQNPWWQYGKACERIVRKNTKRDVGSPAKV